MTRYVLDGLYYVDKTRLAEEIILSGAKVSLFTRPRRFGKSLNMSMLRSFFEIGSDKALFDGLYISEREDICAAYQARFPVISISLKGINASGYSDAFDMLAYVISEEASRFQFLMDSTRLTDADKLKFQKLLSCEMKTNTLVSGLRTLSALLEKHFEEKTVVLIDEYDVPLAKANENGYYDEMALTIRNLFENVLKTNDSLKFAVLTGCLRVAKESIFTGLNNFLVYSITDVDFDEYFGFTDAEVRDILHYYGQDEHYDTVKEWYDGYRFGNVDVYCPWDVVNYCSSHISNPGLAPQNYWVNTSGNDVIAHFIDGIGEPQRLTRTELERIVNGETVQKEIRQDLTYAELYTSMDNLWSTLFMTGYLTQRGVPDGNRYELCVPNREVRDIITEHILKLFKDDVSRDGKLLEAFSSALMTGDADTVERIFTEYMEKTVSVRDTFSRRPIRENFYHGMLLGILAYKAGWSVASNRESRDGFSDIMIRIDDADIGIVLEVKYSRAGNEDADCMAALKQIVDKRYTASLKESGISRILKYGIACNMKKCRVMLEIEDF